MRNIFIFIFCTLSFVKIQAQDFLKNPEYIYAEGRGQTIEDADKVALAALSSTLKVHVNTSSTYKINDENGDLSRYFKQDIQTTSSITLKNCYQYIDNNFTDGYKVYRYINKVEYVKTRKILVKQLLKEFSTPEILDKGTLNNNINLVLGRYYYAYQILDDDLMSIFDYQNDDIKNSIKQRALEWQNSIQMEETIAMYYDVDMKDVPVYGKDVDFIKRPFFDMNYIYIEIRQPNAYNLDFEFWNDDKWSNLYTKSITPSLGETFSNLCRIKCTSSFPRNKFTLNNQGYYKEVKGHKVPTLPHQLKFRVLFQTVDENGDKIRIDVPDDWYVINEVSMALPGDIREWLESDIERGFITKEEAGKIWYNLYQK